MVVAVHTLHVLCHLVHLVPHVTGTASPAARCPCTATEALPVLPVRDLATLTPGLHAGLMRGTRPQLVTNTAATNVTRTQDWCLPVPFHSHV